MGRLFDLSEDEPGPDRPGNVIDLSKYKIIRHRKKNPVHPEEIKHLFYEKSKLRTLATKDQEWLCILTRNDGSKHFAHLRGSYDKAIGHREDLMESGDYEKSWLIMGRS